MDYPKKDIQEIYEFCIETWPLLEDSKILILGGTGFVGKWLVASLGYAQLKGHNIDITVVSRDPQKHQKSFEVAGIQISWEGFDLAKGDYHLNQNYSCIINAATPSSALTGAVDPKYVYDSILRGNHSIVSAANILNSRYIYLSSGAVSMLEETEPNLVREICEKEHIGTLSTAYAHGKKFAETEIEEARANKGLNAQVLRLYAFAGPGLPLDQHFAAGNFMKNFVEDLPIDIKGNPKTERSYMYPTELVIHILNAMTSIESKTREIGSTEVVTIGELAYLITENEDYLSSSVGDSTKLVTSYFPNSNDVLRQSIPLSESIKKWKDWLNSTRR